jgi:hypothetical protein
MPVAMAVRQLATDFLSLKTLEALDGLRTQSYIPRALRVPK